MISQTFTLKPGESKEIPGRLISLEVTSLKTNAVASVYATNATGGVVVSVMASVSTVAMPIPGYRNAERSTIAARDKFGPAKIKAKWEPIAERSTMAEDCGPAKPSGELKIT